ncbi:peptide deformylase [Devosia sp. XK-2]|uniref:peptide deformylase n=1 Tax=Devosia sp. XK-2 TaxID=3126689 RepID=UPI0030CCE271
MTDVAAEAKPFIIFPDDRFQAIATRRPVDANLRAIGRDLLAVAVKANAYGLAAVHIGLVAPVVVVSLGDAAGRDYHILYNPSIAGTWGDLVPRREGSVSMPGIEVDIVRPDGARIAFDDENGVARELALNGFAARVAQHEIDQVNGIFFLSRASRLKRDSAIKRFAKLNRRMG